MPELIRSIIKWLARLGRDPFALLIVVLAGLGTAHILVRTATYGAAVTSDTILHLSTAVNLLAGEGYREHTGEVVAGWPPLFTLLLAASGWVGIEPLAAGRWVNAAAFGLTILAAGLYLHSNLRSRLLALAASGVVLTALPLNHFASYCITEPLFGLFTLLALMQLAAFLNRKTDAPLWWAAVFTSLAALTRYPGVVLIGIGVLILLPLARLRHTLVFGAISSVPLLAVLAHNWTLYRSGGNYDPFLENDLVAEILTEGGEGRGSGQSLSEGLSQTVELFRAWVVPPNAPDGAAYLLWLAVAAVVLAGAAVLCHPNRRQAPEAASPSFGLGPALLFGVFALTYLVFIIVAAPFVVGHEIPDRYLVPIYVPLLLTAVFLLDRFLSIEATGWMAAAQYGLASLVLLGALAHIGYSAHRNLTITDQAYVVGYEKWTYNGSSWEDVEILHYLRDNRIDGQIYSNDPYLAWFWDGTKAPGKHHFFPDEIHYFTSTIMEWTDRDGGHILWIREQESPYNFDEFDIRCLPGVEPVAELSDGVVFRVTAAEPFDEAKHLARKQRYVQQLLERAGEPVIHADSTWPISTWGAEPADEQVARAGWDVYRNGRTLTYRKKPCAPDDMQTNFVLQVIPDEPAYLPADRRPYGFDQLDFNFHMRGGIRLDDQCVATTQLPDYPISRIHIGRWISGNNRMLWEMRAEPFYSAEQRAQRQRYVEQLIQRAGELVIHADSTWPISTWDAEPADEQVARAGWDMYRNGRTLTYRKKPCAPDDEQTNFVLQVIPDEPAYLSADRRQHGYDHLDFNFHTSDGVRLDDQCVVTTQLPDYPISRLYIGRWTSGNHRMLWEMKAKPFAGERHRAQRQRYVQQLLEQAGEPVVRADWDVYRTGRQLIYRKKPCAPADVQAKLVLHVIPTDLKDLPADRKQHGYDGLGFYFNQRGFRLDDQCIAIAQLPDYPIGRIRVGQWIAKEDRTVWEAELLEIGE